MAQDTPSRTTKQTDDATTLKPGSSPDDARKVGGEGDFGAPAGGERTAERDYVSRNTKMSDPGNAQPWDFENDVQRDHGAGARDAGPGSGSGGDVDPDIVGVGTGGSTFTQSGITGRPSGPDDSDGSSDEFASGGHAEGRNQSGVGKVGGTKRVDGTTHSGDLDAGAGGDAQHTAAADDALGDAFAGEVSTGEARGEDNALPPSSDDQG